MREARACDLFFLLLRPVPEGQATLTLNEASNSFGESLRQERAQKKGNCEDAQGETDFPNFSPQTKWLPGEVSSEFAELQRDWSLPKLELWRENGPRSSQSDRHLTKREVSIMSISSSAGCTSGQMAPLRTEAPDAAEPTAHLTRSIMSIRLGTLPDSRKPLSSR